MKAVTIRVKCGTYAVAAAKASTLRAFVTVAKTTAKATVKAIIAPTFVRGFLIKYRISIDEVGRSEDSTALARLVNMRIFFSS
jgi:hypothetical protein